MFYGQTDLSSAERLAGHWSQKSEADWMIKRCKPIHTFLSGWLNHTVRVQCMIQNEFQEGGYMVMVNYSSPTACIGRPWIRFVCRNCSVVGICKKFTIIMKCTWAFPALLALAFFASFHVSSATVWTKVGLYPSSFTHTWPTVKAFHWW